MLPTLLRKRKRRRRQRILAEMETIRNAGNGEMLDDPRENEIPRQEQRNVNIIKIKIPAFEGENPEIYLKIIDAIFFARRITTERRKYVLLLEALSAKHLTKLTPFLDTGNNEEPYTALKEGLLKNFGKTPAQKLQCILKNKPAQSERPSETLNSILMALDLPLGQPINNAQTNTMVKNLFLSKMSEEHQIHLSVYQQAVSPSELADIADRLYDASPQRNSQHQEEGLNLEAMLATKLANLQVKMESVEQSIEKDKERRRKQAETQRAKQNARSSNYRFQREPYNRNGGYKKPPHTGEKWGPKQETYGRYRNGSRQETQENGVQLNQVNNEMGQGGTWMQDEDGTRNHFL